MLKCPDVETIRQHALRHLRRPLPASHLLHAVAKDVGLGWEQRTQRGWLRARSELTDHLFSFIAELVKAGTAKVVERPYPPRSAFVLV